MSADEYLKWFGKQAKLRQRFMDLHLLLVLKTAMGARLKPNSKTINVK